MLADSLISALKGMAQEVSTWTNSGVLHSIEGHIAQIENAVATDIHAGETAAKTVLADLYAAFHGREVPATAAAPAAAPVTFPDVNIPGVTPTTPAVESPATGPQNPTPAAAEPTA